jgi:hypothetical protein
LNIRTAYKALKEYLNNLKGSSRVERIRKDKQIHLKDYLKSKLLIGFLVLTHKDKEIEVEGGIDITHLYRILAKKGFD